MFVHGPEDKHVSSQIQQEGIWEPYETSLLLSGLSSGAVFVDVGANIGYFTIVAATLVGERGQVFAFEPDPSNFALLVKNCEHNSLHSRVHAVKAGLAAGNQKGSLYLSEDNLGDHHIYPGKADRQQLDITLLDGSEYLRPKLQAAGLSHIDLIKIDTQGSEYQVVKGLMPLLLELPCVPSILIELTPFSLRQAGSSGRELIEFLASLKQTFWIVDHIEHQLVASGAEELAQWCDDVDACEGDEGFMNILLGRQIE
jgi:FkbM family methyltransferase